MIPDAPEAPGPSIDLRRQGTAQQPQQTGMLFIITQHVQPDFIIAVMQAQQA
jgi:hypothetical protein